MKAKSTVPEKGKRLESPKVEPPELPVAQANDEHLDTDLADFPRLCASTISSKSSIELQRQELRIVRMKATLPTGKLLHF